MEAGTKTIHIALPDGRRGEYTGEQLRSLVLQGALGAGAVYWTEGMADWRPLAELYPPPQATPTATGPYAPGPGSSPPGWGQPGPMAAGAGRLQDGAGHAPEAHPQSAAVGPYPYSAGASQQLGRFFAQDLGLLTTSVVVLFWVIAFLLACGMAVDMISFSTFSQVEYTTATGVYLPSIGIVLVGLQIACRIALIITFCVWVYRANTNVRAFGAQGLSFTPGWAVGWYFIPFANLIKPYQAMQEVWKASVSPTNWTEVRESNLLAAWWAILLFALIVSFAGALIAQNVPHSNLDVQPAMIPTIGGELLAIVAAILAAQVVRAIYRKQRELIAGAP